MAQPAYKYSGVCYTAVSGQTAFALTSTEGNPIGYLSPDHIHIRTSTDNGETWNIKRTGTAFTFADPGTSVLLVTPATAGEWIDIQRKTPTENDWVDFQAGSLLTAGQLNDAETFSLYCDQELADDIANLTPGVIGLTSTDELPEGSVNLYYTDARVSAWINTNLPNTDQLSEGSSNLYYTNERVEELLESQDYVKGAVVTKIVAGENIGITPGVGTGVVTIAATGGPGGGLTYKGTIDVTGAAPNNPDNGDLWVSTASGPAGSSWTGIAGDPVMIGDRVVYTVDRWQIIPSPSGLGYLPLTGGNLSGNLTLGTDKITLDATSGAASFSGRVETTESVVARNPTNNSIASSKPAGSTGDHFTGIVNGVDVFRVQTDGSATFKSTVQAENADGSTFSFLSSNGSIGGTGNIQLGTYMKLGGDKCVLNENGDGAATFKGNVNVGDTTTPSGGTQISAAGYLYLRSAAGDAATPVIDVYNLNNTRRAAINADGSIVTRSSLSAADGYSGINTSGTIYANRANGSEVLFSGATYGGNVTSSITAAGGAQFGSGIYCNSSAGATVIAGNFAGNDASISYPAVRARQYTAGGYCFQAVNAGGYATWYVTESGVSAFSNAIFNLEADDETKYDVTTEEYTETETYTVEVPVLRPEGVVGTADLVDEPTTRTITKEREVTKTREIRTYNGAVLDVKSELQSLRSRATQQDETIKLMTAALKSLGIDTTSFPSPEATEGV